MNNLIKVTFFLAFLGSGKSLAHQFLPEETHNIYEHSSDIVIGKFETANSEWIDGSLYTVLYFTAKEILKGEKRETYGIALSGGSDPKSKVPVQVSGDINHIPSLNGSVLLFLTPIQETDGLFKISSNSASHSHGLEGILPLTPNNHVKHTTLVAPAGMHISELIEHLSQSDSEETRAHSTLMMNTNSATH